MQWDERVCRGQARTENETAKSGEHRHFGPRSTNNSTQKLPEGQPRIKRDSYKEGLRIGEIQIRRNLDKEGLV